jgi:hypothetical protein
MAQLKVKQEAYETKTEKQMYREQWEQNKRMEAQRAEQIKNMIKY